MANDNEVDERRRGRASAATLYVSPHIFSWARPVCGEIQNRGTCLSKSSVTRVLLYPKIPCKVFGFSFYMHLV